MFLKSATYILGIVKNKSVCIVGAGENGTGLLDYFIRNGVNIVEIFDNSKWLQGKKKRGVIIRSPHNMNDMSVRYVLAVDIKYRKQLREQLHSLGISDDYIVTYYPNRDYEYMRNLEESEYKDEISEMFFETQGFDMDWDKPQTYNEIINWGKIYLKDERRSELADKIKVKKWVADKIGEEYVVKMLNCWDNVDKIDFNNFPENYVLKMNNASGRNIIVNGSEIIDEDHIREQLKKWMNSDYAFGGFETHYKDIIPRILCEEYIEGYEKTGLDYKIYCFNNKPKYIHRIVNEHQNNAKALFYDTKWNVQRFNHGYPNDENIVNKPNYIDKLLSLTEVLCKGFKHVRVDWFVYGDGKILFSEMTFMSWAGIVKFEPPEYDGIFGELIQNGKD